MPVSCAGQSWPWSPLPDRVDSLTVENPGSKPPNVGDPALWLAEHGDALYAYARGRIRSDDVCEDLVQETLIGAWKARTSFAGDSQVRTWLIGILRHKLVDHYRKTSRQKQPAPSQDARSQDAPTPSQWPFDDHGEWKAPPGKWGADPAAALAEQELLKVIADCRDKLPATLAAAYLMREVEELDVPEVCNLLGVTPTHLAVRLHRARALMRLCVEQGWLEGRK